MADYAVFASSEFDPNEYANAILAGEPYPPHHRNALSSTATSKSSPGDIPAKEDISVAISKLNFGIDDISKQIKNVVTAHHEDLLSQASSANNLAGSLTSVREGINDLDSSLEKMRLKVSVPYHSLQTHLSRLQNFQHVSDVLRRTSRFIVLTRRLQGQIAEIENSSARPSGDIAQANTTGVNGVGRGGHVLGLGQDREDEKERTIAKAALSIAELVALLDGPTAPATISASDGIIPMAVGSAATAEALDKSPSQAEQQDAPKISSDASDATTEIPLRSIHAVAAHVPFIQDARAKVTSEMENMVLTGLTTLNQSLLASSLQTAYNLRVLPELVQSLVLDLSQAVEERIRSAFDLAKISKDALGKDSASNTPTSPPMYRSRLRTEPTNLTAPQWTAALWARLESMVEEMAGCCVKVYTLEKVLKMKKDAVSQVVFLDEAMKLLENKPSATFWTSLSRSLEKHARDSAKGSSFLQQTLSTGYPRLLRLFHEFFAKIAVHTDTVYISTYQSPETVLILRALSNFESLYLSRSSNKLNEAVAQAFAAGTRSPPGMNEGMNIARTVANELDSARFDPLLVKAIAKNATASLDMMLSRADGLIVRDRFAVTLSGPAATPQQVSNAQVATCLYHCWSGLEKLGDEHSESVLSALRPNIQSVRQAYERIVDPILTAIRRELGAIIARLHRIDFAKSVDPMSGMGGSSLYMKDLVDKLSFIKTEILSKFNVGEAGRTWVMSIVKFTIRTFVLHVSIAKPLGESGKLQLTSDMTELEFALNAFMIENPQSKRGDNLENVGEDYRALRAMRPLLFLDNAQLASSKHTAGLPPLVVLHHILVRSPIPLPHSLHGWQETEYVRWVDEHSPEEAWTLVESGLSHWEKISESEGKDPKDAAEHIQMARTVLANAKTAS